MADTKTLTNKDAKAIVRECVKTPCNRKVLIENCLKKTKLAEEDYKDKSPNSLLTKTKAILGSVITDYINVGILSLDDKENIILNLQKDTTQDNKTSIDREVILEEIIFRLLKEKSYSRSKLLDAVLEESNLDCDKNAVRGDTGRLLDNAVKNKMIIVKSGNYCLAKTEEELFDSLGDEELVNQSLLMLAQHYKKYGYIIKNNQNTDGANDGGVDGFIETEDKMGYKEKIIIQVKNKKNKNKSCELRDVRGFFGVLSADPTASKGLFIIKTSFSAAIKTFVKGTINKNNKYYVLIDKNKWLQLAKDCNFCISKI